MFTIVDNEKIKVEKLKEICFALLYSIDKDRINLDSVQGLIDEMQDIIDEASNDYWRYINGIDNI